MHSKIKKFFACLQKVTVTTALVAPLPVSAIICATQTTKHSVVDSTTKIMTKSVQTDKSELSI
ncbi:hypothetical protein FACS1894166_07930 [Bacilli bacterium]|nr:hypothetical protein FACS1894166_07930 [Bacilli bacterium]